MKEEEVGYRAPSSTVAWAETLAGTLLVPVIGALFHRHDPLFLTNSFHWLIFPPLLFGIRYGFARGFASALLTVLLMLLAAQYASAGAPSYLLQYALSVVLVGMIAGQFADVWQRRLGRVRLFNEYSDQRLAEFVSSYQLLKVSHDQLEERLASDTHNPRSALMALRQRFASDHDSALLQHRGRDILEFLSAHSQIQRASLYEVFDNKRVGDTPLASLGAPVDCPADHPMLRACLEQGLLISLRNDDDKMLERQGRQKLLAVLPLEDATHHIWAVVAIASMPFVAYHDRALSTLSVLGANFGDVLFRLSRHAGSDGNTTAAADFQTELSLWTHYVKRYGVHTTLMGIWLAPTLSGDDAEQPVDEWLLEQMRGLDVGLRLANAQGGNSLFILMPMTDARGTKGYRERISLTLDERLGQMPDESSLLFHEHPVDGQMKVSELVAELRWECDVVVA